LDGAGFIVGRTLPADVSALYHDLHVHTLASHDVNDEASTFENLARWGHEEGVAVGFADHLDAKHFDDEELCFLEENLGGYLEEFSRAKAQFPEITLGVELEYHQNRPDLMEFTQEWLDLHRRDLDRVLGSAHHVFGGHAVTWHVHMRQLVGKRTFAEIMDEYIRGEDAMVASGMADCLAHADVVFRGNAEIFEIDPEVRRRGEEELLELCRRGVSKGMSIEVNLLGMVYGSDPGPSPSWTMVETLAKEGATISVGSDAHDSAGFRRGLPMVRDAYDRLQVLGARFPFDRD
jgi:HisJ family histidinol phosphate phosphatase